MNPLMKCVIFPIVATITTAELRAEDLSDADREALLGRLMELRQAADSKVDARFRAAISAYRSAMSSEDSTMELYLKCIEKVNFEDQQRKPAEFREWKKREEGKIKDKAFRKALRHQLNWLVLTLQAASEKADRSAMAAGAMESINAVFADAKDLAGHHDLLRQSATGTVFAVAYEIGNVEVENWAMGPAQIDQIFEKILLPPHRTTRNATALRAGWQKRMQYELTAVEFWSPQRAGNGRLGMASATRPPEYEKFLAEKIPQLQWQMEIDIFKHGDQSGAAKRMLAHLDKHLTHASSREWADQFTDLLRPPTGADL